MKNSARGNRVSQILGRAGLYRSITTTHTNRISSKQENSTSLFSCAFIFAHIPALHRICAGSGYYGPARPGHHFSLKKPAGWVAFPRAPQKLRSLSVGSILVHSTQTTGRLLRAYAPLFTFGSRDWAHHCCRIVVQRAAITRKPPGRHIKLFVILSLLLTSTSVTPQQYRLYRPERSVSAPNIILHIVQCELCTAKLHTVLCPVSVLRISRTVVDRSPSLSSVL